MKFVPVFTSLIVIVFLLAFIILPKSSFSEIENRSLASFPELDWDDIKDGDYMSDVSTYLSDHFPLKNTFVNSKTQFEQHVLKMDCINNIYIGKDGYRIEQYEKPENTEKITNPGNKTIYRIYDKTTGKVKADLICFVGETFNTDEDMLLFDPIETWKKTKLPGGSYTMREILVPVFKNGACIYKSPSVMEIAEYCRNEKKTLWDETKRLFYPHQVYVDLSPKLYEVEKSLLDQMSMTD